MPLGATTPMPVMTVRMLMEFISADTLFRLATVNNSLAASRGESRAKPQAALHVLGASEDHRRLKAAETASGGQDRIDRQFACNLGRIVQVALGVAIFPVGGRRHDAVPDHHGAGREFDGANAAQRMADHRFDGANRDLPRSLAQRPFEGGRLVTVVLLGPRAMRVDVVDILGLEAPLP